MSPPLPVTVNVPDEPAEPAVNDALPNLPTAPMSWVTHGAGTAPPVGDDAVVNDQTGPAVVPALLRATTFQKYVVPAFIDVGLKLAVVTPEATDGGGFAVPKLTS
jgi:hypothetical protein